MTTLRNATIAECWAETVSHHARELAIIDRRSSHAWTYADLDHEVDRQCERLGHDLPAGSVVSLQNASGARWLALFLALRKLGHPVVTLDAEWDAAVAIRAASAAGATTMIGLDGTLCRLETNETAPEGATLFKVTSGSSGSPQVIPFTDAEMLADVTQIMATMEIGPGDRNLALLPFSHSYALGNLVLPLITAGVGLTLPGDFIPSEFVAAIRETGCTIFPAIPGILSAFIHLENPHGYGTLRTVISAAAPLSPDLARRFFEVTGLHLHNFYGASETGGIAYDRTGEYGLAGTGIGRPLKGVTLGLNDNGQLEITSSAVSSFLGEHMGEGRSKYAVPDHAEIDEHGCVTIVGRADRIVKVAGRRVDLEELEQRLRKLPGVTDAAIVHERVRGKLHAVYCGAPEIEDLREAIAWGFQDWERPGRLEKLPEIPRSARGKRNWPAIRAALGIS